MAAFNGGGAAAVVADSCRRLPLKDRVAIVTGGAGGIGSALVTAINAAHGGDKRAVAVEVDVSKADQVKALFDAAADAFGPELHILVTAAAVLDYDFPFIAETSEESFDRMFSTNAKGSFLCCREAANRLVQGGGGRIITFSSSGVGSLRPGYGAYAATKGAVEVMTKILARELRGTGITANGVAPGPTATPMFYNGKTESEQASCVAEIPLGRLGQPEDVAPLVGFLASDAGEWVNAQIIRCNGGNI
uniref:Short-chain type dehydrogenase/reductase n=1 Tax=Ananas comosus var. bracteatus TaxID=296719 RepID=A0A6V7NUZ9_ANACO|nr:unnamed protein product [Ananas comosus var. bracteatus]